jgi:hypothetical protein
MRISYLTAGKPVTNLADWPDTEVKTKLSFAGLGSRTSQWLLETGFGMEGALGGTPGRACSAILLIISIGFLPNHLDWFSAKPLWLLL